MINTMLIAVKEAKYVSKMYLRYPLTKNLKSITPRYSGQSKMGTDEVGDLPKDFSM